MGYNTIRYFICIRYFERIKIVANHDSERVTLDCLITSKKLVLFLLSSCDVQRTEYRFAHNISFLRGIM